MHTYLQCSLFGSTWMASTLPQLVAVSKAKSLNKTSKDGLSSGVTEHLVFIFSKALFDSIP